MAALGIGVGVLTGETVEAARDDVFAGLASGRTGIVPTTPEFLFLSSRPLCALGAYRICRY